MLATPGLAWAGDQAVSAGDTGFMMFATALVFLMIPGLALFYGGMVRHKNVLSTIMHSFIMIGLISLQWVLFGYSIAFGPDKLHLFGSLAWLGMQGVGLAGSLIILKVVSLFTKLRVDAADENTGLDLPFHGERAYDHA